jgi:biotin transport system substrate-specific component
MALELTTPNTLLGRMQPSSASARTFTAFATAVLGTALLTLSAKINVPLLPVPVTLQTFAFAVLAAAMGWRIALATVALYIAEGLAGLPVFAYGGGPLYVFNPTFGFIVGGLPMAWIIGRAVERFGSGNGLRLFAAMVGGDVVCFLCGYLWFVLMSGSVPKVDQANVLASSFALAVAPFIVWDLLKMAFAAATVSGAWALLRRKDPPAA